MPNSEALELGVFRHLSWMFFSFHSIRKIEGYNVSALKNTPTWRREDGDPGCCEHTHLEVCDQLEQGVLPAVLL